MDTVENKKEFFNSLSDEMKMWMFLIFFEATRFGKLDDIKEGD